jgi:hypothetical protein
MMLKKILVLMVSSVMGVFMLNSPAQATHPVGDDGGHAGWGSGSMSWAEWNNVYPKLHPPGGDTQWRVQNLKCDCTGGVDGDGPDKWYGKKAKEVIYHTTNDDDHLAYVRYVYMPNINGGEWQAYKAFWCDEHGDNCLVYYYD